MLIYRKVKMINQPKKTSRQYKGCGTISREDPPIGGNPQRLHVKHSTQNE